MRIGYFLSSEECGPRDLVRRAQMAEEARFDALRTSDQGADERFFETFAREVLARFDAGGGGTRPGSRLAFAGVAPS